MTRANGIAYAVFFMLLVLGIRSCGFNTDQIVNATGDMPVRSETGPVTVTDVDPGIRPQQPGNSREPIIVGAFNIQIFGVAKSNDGFVMQHLVDIARRFDLLAIQELRAEDQTVVSNFVRMINSDGSR